MTIPDPDGPARRYVDRLPELITTADYAAHETKTVRLRIQLTDKGIEILGDSMYPEVLQELLRALGPSDIEAVLCG